MLCPTVTFLMNISIVEDGFVHVTSKQNQTVNCNSFHSIPFRIAMKVVHGNATIQICDDILATLPESSRLHAIHRSYVRQKNATHVDFQCPWYSV